MTLYDLKEGNKIPAKFTSGKISLGFKVEGKLAQVIIKYKYYPSNDSISYIDVEYTDPKLQSMIENNADMMTNIDNYIRRVEQTHAKKSSSQD
jgi:hypothetical protein